MSRVAKTEHPYIVKVKGVCGGGATIRGTRIPVWIIAGWVKDGYTPEQIQGEMYPHLTLAQIHDALSYYYDHLEEIDKEIAANAPSEEEFENWRQKWLSPKSS